MADTEDDRWTLRGVPVETQQQVKAAAGRAQISIGKWACNAFDLALDAEREPIDMRPPPTVSDKLSDMSAGGLAELTAALHALVEAYEVGLPVSRSVARDVGRVMRAKVREAGGLPPLKGRAPRASIALLGHADDQAPALVNGAGALAG